MHAVKTTKAKYILTQPDLIEPVKKAASTAGFGDDRILIFNPHGETAPKGYTQWQDLLEHGEQDWVRFDDLEATRNSTAAMLFSSGTTGLPKAAILSHHNLVAQHTLVYEAPRRPWKAVRLFMLPMFHAATVPVSHTTPLRTGEKAYVMPRFEPETWFKCIEKYGITDIAVVPPIAVMAINSPLKDKYSFRSAKVASVGAAPLDKHPQSRFQALLGVNAPMTQVWGMTETSCIATRFRHPNYDTTGSVGYPIPNLDSTLR